MEENETKWPTLEGRLKAAPTSELEVLLQLSKSIPLSEHGQKRLKELLDISQKAGKLPKQQTFTRKK